MWRFPLHLDGLTAELDDEFGHVWLRDPALSVEADPVAWIPHGWMVDAAFGTNPDEAASYSEGVTYTLEETRDGVTLVVTLDDAWLDDPAREWPVVVDPTLTQFTAGADDTFVTPYVTTDRSTLTYLYAGSLGMFENRAYLHLDTTSVASKVIHHAEIKALQTDGTTCASTNTNLFRVTAAWAGLNLTWLTKPTVDSTPLTTAYTTQSYTADGGACSASEWAVWGASDLVRNWADGTWANHGIMLNAPAGAVTDPDHWKKFGSADATWKPHLLVVWSEPTASGAPDAPTDLLPSGVIGDPLAPLSATFTDPDEDRGSVVFYLYDDTTNELIGVLEGDEVDSGQTSTFTPTTGMEGDYDRPYRIEAHAKDEHGNLSLTHTETTVTVSSAALTDPADGDTAFHTETIAADSVGAYSITSVDFYIDDELIDTDTNGVDGWSVDWDTTEEDDGEYTLTATLNTASGSYPTVPVAVEVNNALTGPERTALDFHQGALTEGEYVQEAVGSLLRHGGVGERYVAPIGAMDEATTPILQLHSRFSTVFEEFADLGWIHAVLGSPVLNPYPPSHQQAWFDDHVLEWDLEPEPGNPLVYDDCSGANLRWGFVNAIPGNWCHTEYIYTGSEPNIPDLDFYYTVGPNITYGDVQDAPVSSVIPLGNTSAPEVPEYVRDAATNTFEALEIYSRDLGFELPDQFTRASDPLDYLTIVVANERGFANPFNEEVSITLPAWDPFAAPRHETFHVYQYNYLSVQDIWPGDAGWWFLEASAEWADHQAVELGGLAGEPYHYSEALSTVFNDPEDALTTHAPPDEIPWVGDDDDNRRGYGSFIFAEYLDDHLPAGSILDIFETIQSEGTETSMLDAIEAKLELADHSWSDFLPSYWAASYLLSESPALSPELSFHDDDVAVWRSQLPSSDPLLAGDSFSSLRRAARAFPPTTLTEYYPTQGPLTQNLWPGGARFYDVSLEANEEATVTPSVRVDAEHFESGDAQRLQGTWLAYDWRGYPHVCWRDGAHVVETAAFSDATDASSNPIAVWEESIRLDERCPTATLVITHVDPQELDADEIPVVFELEAWGFSSYDDNDLDETFATGNYAIFDGYTGVADLLVQPDNDKILALLQDDDTTNVSVVRLHPNGGIDSSFGDAGIKQYPGTGSPGSLDLLPFAIGYVDHSGTIDDEIVIAVHDRTDSTDKLRLIWLEYDGDPITTQTLGASDDLTPKGFLVDQDGRPVFTADADDNPAFIVARWSASTRTLDSSFGLGGVVAIAPGSETVNYGIATFSDRYVVAGRAVYPTSPPSSELTLWALGHSSGAVVDTAIIEDCGIETRAIVASPGESGVVVHQYFYNGDDSAASYFAHFDADLNPDSNWAPGGCYEDASFWGSYIPGLLASDSAGRLYRHVGPLSYPYRITQVVPPGASGHWTDFDADTGDTDTRIDTMASQTLDVSGTPTERMLIGGGWGPYAFIARFEEHVGANP